MRLIGCAVPIICLVAVAGWFLFTVMAVGHDKSMNSRLQVLWEEPRGVPLGIVVPADNRWIENAFVAEASDATDKQIAVLLLDDHYMSGDYSLRSRSGVIGDKISREVLCSVPAQARTANVDLDAVIQRVIAAECLNVR